MEKRNIYKVDREFCEKLVALLNRSTNPVMDIFRPDKDTKMQIVIDYDPQKEKIEITYYERSHTEDCRSDVVEDAERILDMLNDIEEKKRPFVVTIMTAYMNGLEAGEAYAMQRMLERGAV